MTPGVHRIISLLPAGTEIIAALGLAESLVAISHECDYPAEITHLPRVTASAVDRDATSSDIDASARSLSQSGLPVFTLDSADIVRMAPTVILTQSLCDVCAVSEGDIRDFSQVLSPSPDIIPLAGTTLEGIREDIRRVAAAVGHVGPGEGLISSFDSRLRDVHDKLKSAKASRPRVAVVEWLNPLFVAGHWTPELVRRAGGVDVLATPGSHSVRTSVDVMCDAQPDIVLFAPCGFDVERSLRESRELLGTPEWAWAGDVQCWAIDGNALTSRPGPRLADAVEVMAAIFAPTLFAPPAVQYAQRLQ